MSNARELLDQTREVIARFGRGYGEGDLTESQRTKLAELRENGYATFDHLVGTQKLKELQADYKRRLEGDLEFETPVLAQAKIDPVRHAEMIKANFRASNAELAKHGLTVGPGDFAGYDEMVDRYQPSTLTTYLPSHMLWFGTWLDAEVLPVVQAYMGFTPQLTEAYIRRNFPAHFVVMNHAWHRDSNHARYLLKSFFFLTDCTEETGPHHFICGSVENRALDGSIYYTDDEVRSAYASSREVVSVVPAGTIILEDTRALHKAGIPQKGYRDLGYAVFLPPMAFSRRPPMYRIADETYRSLTPEQQRFIPPENVSA